MAVSLCIVKEDGENGVYLKRLADVSGGELVSLPETDAQDRKDACLPAAQEKLPEPGTIAVWEWSREPEDGNEGSSEADDAGVKTVYELQEKKDFCFIMVYIVADAASDQQLIERIRDGVRGHSGGCDVLFLYRKAESSYRGVLCRKEDLKQTRKKMHLRKKYDLPIHEIAEEDIYTVEEESLRFLRRQEPGEVLGQLRNARSEAEKILSEARESARQIKSEASVLADKIRADASAAADKLRADTRTDAQTQADEILEKARSEARQILAQAQAEADAARKEAETFRKEAEAAKNEAEAAREDAHKSREEASASRKESADARKDLNGLEVKIAQARAAAASEESRLEASKKELSDCETQLVLTNAELVSTKAKTADVKTELTQTQEKLNEAQLHLSVAQTDVKKMREQAEALKEELTKADEEFTALKQQLDTVKGMSRWQQLKWVMSEPKR